MQVTYANNSRKLAVTVLHTDENSEGSVRKDESLFNYYTDYIMEYLRTLCVCMYNIHSIQMDYFIHG